MYKGMPKLKKRSNKVFFSSFDLRLPSWPRFCIFCGFSASKVHRHEIHVLPVSDGMWRVFVGNLSQQRVSMLPKKGRGITPPPSKMQ